MKEIEGKATFVETDVRYFENLYTLAERYKPQFIYHLAAQSSSHLVEKPQETLETNVIGTANHLRHKAHKGQGTLRPDSDRSAFQRVTVTNEREVPISESHALLPLHPYGVSSCPRSSYLSILGHIWHQRHKGQDIQHHRSKKDGRCMRGLNLESCPDRKGLHPADTASRKQGKPQGHT